MKQLAATNRCTSARSGRVVHGLPCRHTPYSEITKLMSITHSVIYMFPDVEYWQRGTVIHKI